MICAFGTAIHGFCSILSPHGTCLVKLIPRQQRFARCQDLALISKAARLQAPSISLVHSDLQTAFSAQDRAWQATLHDARGIAGTQTWSSAGWTGVANVFRDPWSYSCAVCDPAMRYEHIIAVLGMQEYWGPKWAPWHAQHVLSAHRQGSTSIFDTQTPVGTGSLH